MDIIKRQGSLASTYDQKTISLEFDNIVKTLNSMGFTVSKDKTFSNLPVLGSKSATIGTVGTTPLYLRTYTDASGTVTHLITSD